MLLLVEKVIQGRICCSIYQYAKDITNTSKIMRKIKNRHFSNIRTKIIYMLGQCC